jgi:hypothetical protein
MSAMLAPGPTAYGWRNNLKTLEAGWQWYKDNIMLVDENERVVTFRMEDERAALVDKLKIEVFQDIERETFCDQWQALVERVKR